MAETRTEATAETGRAGRVGGAARARTARAGGTARADRAGRAGRAGGGAADRGWKPVFVLLLVTAVLAAVCWVLLGSRLLVVRQIEVTGNELVPRDRLIAAADVRLGQPMARLDTEAVRDRVAAVGPVERARVQRRWPGTVRVVVRERVPVAVVEHGGRFRRIDRHGVIIAESATRPPGLPALVVADPGPHDQATVAALRVLRGLPARLTGRLTTVEAPTVESVTLRLRPDQTIVWGADDRRAEKIRLIDALIGTPAGRSAKVIDVSAPEVVTTS